MREIESLLPRVMRFLRSALVGGAATIVDFATLECCARLLGMEPTHAKLPALAAGALVQFVGSRTFAFRARGGSMRRQAALFALTELATLSMNWLMFRLLVGALRVPMELANAVGTFVVFAGFSYPMWRAVFRVPAAAAPAGGEGAADDVPRLGTLGS
jgi:putative flippase GtrA